MTHAQSHVQDEAHVRPHGLSDGAVEALGALSDALETVEQVRGHFYALHQLTGSADFKLDRAVELLHKEGYTDWAARIRRELIGRNLIQGRWTFQIVEEFDDGYYATFRNLEKEVRDDLADGKRHIYEAELKDRRRTAGLSGHEKLPDSKGG